MGIDVDQVLKRYEDAANNEPMHGKSGEVRRNPSTDQKKERREMAKTANAEDPQPTETELLAKAAKSNSLQEQRELLTQVEAIRTARMQEADDARSIDTTAKITDTLIPGHVHELHTASTDWLLELPEYTASQTEAEHALIAEAVAWYGRVDPVVKADAEEFQIQAANKARHVASQYIDHAEPAAQAFMTEATRLLRHEAKLGKVAIQIHDLDNGGMIDDPGFNPEPSAQAQAQEQHHQEQPAGHPEPAQAEPAEPARHGVELEHHNPAGGDLGFLRQHLQADTSSVPGMAAGWANHVLSSAPFTANQIRRAAALSREATAADDEESAETLFGDDTRDDYKTAASTLDQVGVPQQTMFGPGADTALSPEAYPDANTDSNRAPALQELQNYNGWTGTSVVPGDDNHAETENGQAPAHRDAAYTDARSQGFPVGGSLHHTASKESSMDHAQCPTCGGAGKVAVRRATAASGLPQVDQIVNADESPGTTPLPTDVAWPLVGLNQDNVAKAINETEGQIAQRNKLSPAMGSGAAGGPPYNAYGTGQDNSGWIGDDGAKGLDYPGYSAPQFDGSTNLGQPDPVYGYGGDQPQGPRAPYGAEEANDFTNNPGEPYDPSVAHNNDRGFAEVTQPGLATSQVTNAQGAQTQPSAQTRQRTSSQDPFLMAANEEIARQQELIRQRTAMLQAQGR